MLTTSPNMAATAIPKVTALRRALDYGDAQLLRCITFNDDTRMFRRRFQTTSGVSGIDLHNWKSREHQAGLNEMTMAFLEKAGNGQVFWPNDKSAANYNKYQYSKDHARIKKLIKQLFFRLNQQQFQNQKYKKKLKSNAATTAARPLEERGTSRETALDINSLLDTIISTDSGDSQSSNVSPAIPSLFTPSSTTHLPADPCGPHRVGESSTAATSSTIAINEQRKGDDGVDGAAESGDVYSVPLGTLPPPPSCARHLASTGADRQFQKPKRHQTLEDSIADGQQQQPPKRQKTQKRTKDAVEPEATAKRSRRRPQPLRPDEYVRDLAEISRYVSPGHDDPEPESGVFPAGEEETTIVFRPSIEDYEDNDGHNDGPIYITAGPTVQTNDMPHPVAPFAPMSIPTSAAPSEAGVDGPSSFFDARPPPMAVPSPIPSIISPSPTVAQHPSPAPPSPPPTPRPFTATPTNTASPLAKPSVGFTYRLVLTRHPYTISERWAPAGGRFQDKTLTDLRRELPFPHDSSPGLVFTVKSQCMRIVERIAYGDEEGFETMKRYISTEVGGWLGRQRRGGRTGGTGAGGRLMVDILIERMPVPGVGGCGEEEAREGWGEEVEEVEW